MQDGSDNKEQWSTRKKPKRDITLGTLWFVLSLYCILPLVQLLSAPLTGFMSFVVCIMCFLGAKFWINEAKKCWFPT